MFPSIVTAPPKLLFVFANITVRVLLPLTRSEAFPEIRPFKVAEPSPVTVKVRGPALAPVLIEPPKVRILFVPRTSKAPPPVVPPRTMALSEVSDAADSHRKVPVLVPLPNEMVAFLPKELGEPELPRFETVNCPAPTVVTPSNVLSLRVM